MDRHLFELFSKEELTAEKFVSLLDISPAKSRKTARSALHKEMLFAVKGHLLKKRLRIPKLYEMKNMASKMLASEYAFSGINHYLLSYLAGLKDSSVPEAHKQLIEFQLFEMLGYILQSQAWLSPAQYAIRIPSERNNAFRTRQLRTPAGEYGQIRAHIRQDFYKTLLFENSEIQRGRIV